MSKYVYFFGGKEADGDGTMKELLGGKGAGLAEMVKLNMPVPAGFTITTDVCTYYYKHNRQLPEELMDEIKKQLLKTEEVMECKFEDPDNPLLLSVRSGARKSMPGMMETVLNVGLSSVTIPGLIKKTNNPRFVYDAYRRLIMMYSDVVMEKAAGREYEEGKGIRVQLDKMIEDVKRQKGYKSDTDITADDLKDLCVKFKERVKDVLERSFDDRGSSRGRSKGGLQSWNGKRAIAYRK